jgi:DNA-binding IclR family transcriptional regulator
MAARGRPPRRREPGPTPARQEPGAHIFRSAYRALLLLDRIERSLQGKRLGELSCELGIDKATAFRLLETLIAERVLVKDADTGRYASDLASWAYFAEFLHPATSLMSSVQTVLEGVTESTGATCVLVLPEVDGPGALAPMYALPDSSLYFDPGRPSGVSPLHGTAAGKCYLADLPKEDLNAYLGSPLVSATESTITSPYALRRELGRVRRQGYALNQGETWEGSSVLGVPLRDPAGRTVGGLSLGFVGREVARGEAPRVVPRLAAGAQQVSSLLTYRSWLGYVRQSGAERIRSLSPWDTPDPGLEEGGVPRVRTVARMVRLTGLLFMRPQGLLVSEVAQARRLRKSTAWRLLNTLSSAGTVWQDTPDGRYRISPLFWLRRAAVLGSAASRDEAIVGVLTELAEAVGETVCIAVPAREGRVGLAAWHALPNRPICWRVKEGPVGFLHTTGVGKCYLAAQPRRRLEDYLRQGLPPMTSKTITSREQFLRELEEVRRQGYALCREEMSLGLNALAVPLLDASYATVGGLAVMSVTTEVTPARIQQWLPLVRQAAARVARLLGTGSAAERLLG